MQRLCDGLISRPRSPTDCVKDKETEKSAKIQQRAVEPEIDGCLRAPALLLALISAHVYIVITVDVLMRRHGC
jgi:hypothetical protein